MAAPTYKPHPLARDFPPMEGKEFEDIVEDIRSRGLNQPIVLHEGMILDGNNRYRACLEAEVPPRFVQFTGGNATAFVWSQNGVRRNLLKDKHLDLKKKFAKKLLTDDPEMSDRRVAETAHVSPTTVGKIRAEMEQRGDVSTVDTRRDVDGRMQPAHKPERAPPSADRQAAADLIERVVNFVAALDAIDLKQALRGLAAKDRDWLQENIRRAQARLSAIWSLVITQTRPAAAVATIEIKAPDESNWILDALQRPESAPLPVTPPVPAAAERRCVTCGQSESDGELFGCRDKATGAWTWFCLQHRKAYSDARTGSGEPPL